MILIAQSLLSRILTIRLPDVGLFLLASLVFFGVIYAVIHVRTLWPWNDIAHHPRPNAVWVMVVTGWFAITATLLLRVNRQVHPDSLERISWTLATFMAEAKTMTLIAAIVGVVVIVISILAGWRRGKGKGKG